jgi:hypothetical protein
MLITAPPMTWPAMRVRHLYPTTSSRSDVTGQPAFFQRNQAGNTLTLYTTRQSRYEGWTVGRGERFLKLIERITPLDSEGQPLGITEITDTGSSAYWELHNGVHIGWKLLATLDGLTVRSSQSVRLEVTLDIRDSYASPGFGRQYDVSQDSTGTLVRYQDTTLTAPAFLHLRSRLPLQLLKQWRQVEYPRDVARHSQPANLYTYILGVVDGESLALGYGESADVAASNSLAASRQRPITPGLGGSHSHETLVNQVATARLGAAQGMRWLQSEAGQWAGLPWFHQVWSRDELIAGLGLTRDLQHELLDRYLGYPLIDGELPTYQGSGTTCADGLYWLCLLARQYAEPDFPNALRDRLTRFLRRAYEGVQKQRSAAGFVHSGHNATWMDTIGREGYRIEIQAGYALLLELLGALTSDETFERERLGFVAALKHSYFKAGYLYDAVDDATKRPNVFLAYLLQPQLLSAKLWQSCFDRVLEALKLEWGGLASIDRASPYFQSRSTGEDNLSYHNGDSWFFVNNLAAVALHRFNAKRYGNVITGILESSTEEILWHNFLGLPGEISSAEKLDSWGCGLQAFSAGTYLLLLREMEGYSAGQELDATAFFWDSTADSSALSFFK